MTLEDIERMISGEASRCEEAIAQVRKWVTRATERDQQDIAIDNRDKEWSQMVRNVVISDEHHLDESDDPEELRVCLTRTRLGASAERQCAATRSAVVDVYDEILPSGAKAARFVVSVPTGDMGELREVSRMFIAAWVLANGDVKKSYEYMEAIANGPEAP